MQAAGYAVKLEVLALYWALGDPRTGLGARLLVLLLLTYGLSPFDFVQELTPVLAVMADLVVLPLLVWLILKAIPSEVMADARRKAGQCPLRLRQDWGLALCIYVVWVMQFVVAIKIVSRHVDPDSYLHVHRSLIMAVTAGSITLVFMGLALWRLRIEARQDEDRRCSAGGLDALHV